MKLLLAVLFAFPLFHFSHAPAVFRTRIETTAGSFVIETHRDWSPKGADRFYELVREHYYDNSRFFRVVPERWVQFGIAGDPKVAQAWRHKTIPDDTLKVHNKPGYVAFSNTGPGTRSTQVYINLRDNSALNDSEAAFAPFGKVVEVLACCGEALRRLRRKLRQRDAGGTSGQIIRRGQRLYGQRIS
jgi:cyclophilin family peptidyl-prolyl cis-trans isomerase